MQARRGLAWLAWLATDIIGVLAFCAVGRRSHAEGVTITGVATTAWPFLTGTLVGWLASPAAGMVTGASYTMDGGWSAR